MRRKLERSPFFHGMTRVSALALAGAMLLALSLLVDVYGADWAAAAHSDDVSLALAALGAGLVLLSIYLDRRARRRGR